MKLTLVNHACVKIQTDTLGILCDPWTEGSAFNLGWDLLINTPLSFEQILDGVTHIWLSHEHPDHFVPAFISQVAKSHKDKVTILFQWTRDRRVASFCEKQGLKVIELQPKKPTKLNDEVTVINTPVDFYDSWLWVSDGRDSVLNINDCHTRTDKDAEEVARIVPSPTVLLTQYSYASWKGGKDNQSYRALAARQKLETMQRQIRILRPKYTVPFASLIYFSNQENSYLNDLINTPRMAANAIAQSGAKPIVLYPADSWEVDKKWDNSEPLVRYDRQFEAMNSLPLRPPGESASTDELRPAFIAYQKKLFTKNSPLLINLVSKLPVIGAFAPIIVETDDTGALYSVSVTDGLTVLKPGEQVADVKMHSSSLLFIFKQEFGYDTLMVNGRFESSNQGFSKMAKAWSVGSLNAMGLSLSYKLLFDFRLIVMLLRILAGVLTKLSATAKKDNSSTKLRPVSQSVVVDETEKQLTSGAAK